MSGKYLRRINLGDKMLSHLLLFSLFGLFLNSVLPPRLMSHPPNFGRSSTLTLMLPDDSPSLSLIGYREVTVSCIRICLRTQPVLSVLFLLQLSLASILGRIGCVSNSIPKYTVPLYDN
ncbi:hypothetical protein DMENIID0001_066600 [Sergentomyia squamirostris]